MGFDLLRCQLSFLKPGLGEEQIPSIDNQNRISSRCEVVDVGCFPGQTAQRLSRSPARLDFPLYIPRCHDLKYHPVRNGISYAAIKY